MKKNIVYISCLVGALSILSLLLFPYLLDGEQRSDFSNISSQRLLIASLKPGQILKGVLVDEVPEKTILVIRESDLEYLISEGKKSKPYREISDAFFSQDGKHFYLIAKEFSGNITEKKTPFSKGSEDSIPSKVLRDGSEELLRADTIEPQFLGEPNAPLVFIVRNKDKYSLIINGKKGKEYDSIEFPSLAPNSKDVVYEVVNFSDGSSRVVFNGTEGPSYKNILSSRKTLNHFQFTEDGRLVYFARKKVNQEVVVVGTKEEQTFDTVFDLKVIGNQIAYIACRGRLCAEDNNLWEHRVYRKCKIPSEPKLEPIEQKKYFLVINGEEGKAYDEVLGPYLSVDGTKLGAITREGDIYTIWIDGKKIASEEAEEVNELVFSSETGAYAYRIRKDNQEYVVHNGKKGKTYSAVCELALNPPGNRLAYTGAKKIITMERQFIVIDGKEGKSFGTVKDVAFDKKKNDFRWVGWENMASQAYIGNQKEKKSYRTPTYYSPDGKSEFHFEPECLKKEMVTMYFGSSYGCTKSKNRLVINGKKQKPYDKIFDIFWNRDGSTLTYVAQEGNKLWWIVNEIHRRP